MVTLRKDEFLLGIILMIFSFGAMFLMGWAFNEESRPPVRCPVAVSPYSEPFNVEPTTTITAKP